MPPDLRLRLRIVLRILCVQVVCWAMTGPATAARPANLLSGFARTQLVIETSRNNCRLLEIFLADTDRQHSQGLMFIERLGEFEGMLFRYHQPARLTMWMKNTYIALDMLFVRADGTIVGIEEYTKPLSTRPISSPEPVTSVLELNA